MYISSDQVINYVVPHNEGEYWQIDYGATLTLVDGGHIYLGGFPSGYPSDPYYYSTSDVLVYGSLVADFSTRSEAITGSCIFSNIRIAGTASFRNADITLGGSAYIEEEVNHDHSSYYPYDNYRIYVDSNASFCMEGGILHLSFKAPLYDQETRQFVYVSAGGSMQLAGTEVDADIELQDSYNALKAVLKSDNSVFLGAIELYDPDSLQGSGNIFQGERIMYISKGAADLSPVWNFIGACTAPHPYITIGASSSENIVLTAPPTGKENIHYELGSISRKATVTLAQGVRFSWYHKEDSNIPYNATYASIYGTVIADFQKGRGSAFWSAEDASQHFVSVYGSVQLKNADILFQSPNSSFSVSNGGSLEMENATLTVKKGLTVYSGSSIHLDQVNVTDALKLTSGSNAEITNSKLAKLDISLLVDSVQISGCDLSTTIFSFSDTSAGGVIDLSGNNWGTSDRNVVMARLGENASHVYIGELVGEFTGTCRIVVTNANDDGEGSLRWALAQAENYQGNERIEICFDNSLAGETIALSADLFATVRSRLVNLGEDPVRIAGAALRAQDELYLENMVMEKLVLEEGTTLTGTGNIITGHGGSVVIEGADTFLGLLDVQLEQEDAYVALSGEINNSHLACGVVGYPFKIVQESILVGNANVEKDQTLELSSQASLTWRDGTLTVYGEMTACYDALVDGIVSESGSKSHNINIKEGGSLNLKNSSVDLNGGKITVSGYSSLTMEGGVLNGSIESSYSASTAQDRNANIITLNGATVQGDIRSTGTTSVTASFQNCQLNGIVHYYGYGNKSLHIENCTISSYIKFSGDNNDKSLTGSGNTFTGDCLFHLDSGVSVSTLQSLSSLIGNVTSPNAYISFASSFDADTTLTVSEKINSLVYKVRAPQGFYSGTGAYPGEGYFLGEGDAVTCVNQGVTLTLTKGACLGFEGTEGWTADASGTMNEQYGFRYFSDDPNDENYYGYWSGLRNGILVRGAIEASFDENADAFYSTESMGRIAIVDGGCLRLSNANARLLGAKNDIWVGESSTLSVADAKLIVSEGITAWGGNLELSHLTMQSDITLGSSASLLLEHVEMVGSLTIGDSCSAVINNTTGIRQLVFSPDAATFQVSGNDFSHTEFVFSSPLTSTLYLGGNYWGTTNVDEILSRFGDNASYIDLGNILTEAPGTEDLLYVTTTADSGNGSLRAALSVAAEDVSLSPQIRFAPTLAGQSITLESPLTLDAGILLELTQGVSLDVNGNSLTVNGSLVSENLTEGSAIYSSSAGGMVVIGETGNISLYNGNITNINSMTVSGSLSMNGGILSSAFSLDLNATGRVQLDDVDIKSVLDNRSGGTLQIQGCTVSSSILLSHPSDIIGKNNTLTDEGRLYLMDFSGNTFNLLEMFDALDTSTPSIWLNGTLTDSILSACPKKLGGRYGVDVNLVIEGTVVFESGVTLELDRGGLSVNGSLSIPDAGSAEVFRNNNASSGIINVSGKISLSNAQLNSTGEGWINLNITEGEFIQQKGSLSHIDAIVDGGLFRLQELESGDLVLDINNGILKLEDSSIDAEITFTNTAHGQISNCNGITSLVFDGCQNNIVISGNDLSSTRIDLASLGTGVIDLSGNYWGTTDKNEIISRIDGYDADHVILDSWLSVLPGDEFKFLGLESKGILSAQSSSLELNFTHQVDISSITPDNLYLENLMGTRIEITGADVSGEKLMIHFDPLPTDGKYALVIGDSLCNIHGNGITFPDGASECRLNVMADVCAESIVQVRLEEGNVPGYIDVVLSGSVNPYSMSLDGISLLAPDGSAVTVTGWNMPTSSILRLFVNGLPAVGDYSLTLPAGVSDNAGNTIKQNGNGFTFAVESADVRIEASESNYTGEVNSTVSVAVCLDNRGNAVAECSTVEIWLTPDGAISSSSVLLDSFDVGSLEAGCQLQLQRQLQLAPSLISGEYQLIACVSNAQELQVLQGNNTASVGKLTIAYPPSPDLALTDITLPDSVLPGEMMDVHIQIANQGKANAVGEFKVHLALVADGRDVSSAISLGSYTIGEAGMVLSSGATLQLTLANVRIPEAVGLSGSVRVLATVDPDSTVYEPAEGRGNNTLLSSEVMQLSPKLFITLSGASIAEGSTNRLTLNVTRSGDCSQALTVHLDAQQASRLNVPETLVIAAGSHSATHKVTVIDNDNYTGDEQAVITANAEGYLSSSASLDVHEDEQPSLRVALSASQATEGIVLQGTITMDTVSTTDTVIKLGSTLSSQISMPSTVTILAGQTSASFDIHVVNDEVAEIDKTLKITAAADGFNSGSAELTVVDDDLPQVQLVLSKDIVSESDGYYAITGTLVRSGGSLEAITVKLQDVDGIGLILPASVPMGAGVTSVKFTIGVVDDALVNGERTGTIRGSITIDDCGCDASSSALGGVFETTLTVQDNDSPALRVSLSKTVLREGGEETAVLTVTSNYVSDQDVFVTLSDAGLLNLPASITIPAGQKSVTCEVTAMADGVADGTQYTTIVAAADGFVSGHAYMQVTDMDVPDLVVDSIAMDGAAIAGQKITVNVVLRNQGYASTSQPVTAEITLSDGTKLGTVSTTEAVAVGEKVMLQTEVTLPAVSGNYILNAVVDSSNAAAELEENNNFGSGIPVVIGSGYSIDANIVQDILYTASPISIEGNLKATTMGVDASNCEVTLYLYHNGSLMKTLSATTDADGSFITNYRMPEGFAGEFSIKAGVFSEVSDTLDTVAVAGLSVNAETKDLQWLLELGSSKSGSITITNTGAVDLHNVNLQVLSLPSNIQFSIDTPSVDLAIGESAIFHYSITGDALNVGNLYAPLSIQAISDEGVSATATGYSYVKSKDAVIEISSNNLEFTADRSSARYVEISICNIGSIDTGKVTIELPDLDWLSLYSNPTIENIAPGEKTTVVLKADASKSDILLNAPYGGNVVINTEKGNSKRINYDITFVDSDKCTLTVNTIDAYSMQRGEAAIISHAKVRVYNAYTQQCIASGYTDDEGNISFENLESGAYYMYVDAEGCNRYSSNFVLEPGSDQLLNTYLYATTIQYTFNVTPTEIEEQYNITHDVEFVSNVPTPVVVFNENEIEIPQLYVGDTVYFSFTVSNYGLVEARNYRLELPEDDNIVFEILNPITSLAAQSSHEFWVKVTALDPNVGSTEKSGILVDMTNGAFSIISKIVQWFVGCDDEEPKSSSATLRSGQITYPDIPLYEHIQSGDNHDFGTNSSSGSVPIYIEGGDGPLHPLPPRTPVKYKTEEKECNKCVDAIIDIVRVPVTDMVEDVEDLIPDTFWETVDVEKMIGYSSNDLKQFWWNSSSRVNFLQVAKKLAKVAKFFGKVLVVIDVLEQLSEAIQVCLSDTSLFGAGKYLRSAASWVDKTIKDVKGWVNNLFGFSGDKLDLCEKIWELFKAGVVEGDMNSVAGALSSLVGLNAKVNDCILGAYGLDDKGASSSEYGHIITDEERSMLLNEPGAQLLGADHINACIDRWNRTVKYRERGILYLADVPEGESTDFFSQDYLDAKADEMASSLDSLESSGYTEVEDYVLGQYDTLVDYLLSGSGEVCASVQLSFSQTAVMSREAFEGLFSISNKDSESDLKDIEFHVYVTNQEGVDFSDHFRITYYGLEGLDSIEGGTLGGGASGQVSIQFIPDKTIAQQGSELYDFCGTLSYTDPDTGRTEIVNLAPVTLQVNPSPNLQMHYFLSENIYSDDPFTEEKESAQIAELGLLINNKGLGVAKNFTLSNFHPDYVRSDQGLALELELLGSSVNGGALQQSGTSLSFGNIEGNSSTGAIWYFKTSMQGIFENYEATFTRVDSLGNIAYLTNGTDVSLIDSVTTHMLVRSMDADGDSKTDFLVNDVDDVQGMADGLYLGNGQYEEVQGIMFASSSSGSLGNGSNTIVMTAKVAEGWNYIRINDPGEGNYRIVGISVGGTELDPSMFWQTDRVFAPDGSASYVDRLHWVYETAADGYVEFALTYDPVDEKAPAVEAFDGVTDKTTVRNAVEAVTVVFSEAVNPDTFSLENVRLRLQNTDVDLTGLVWEWADDKTLRLTNLANYTQNDGLYVLQVLNGGVEDVYGNAGDGAGRQIMWTKATNKVAVELLAGYESVRPNSRVGSLTVTFTESVSGFDASALQVIYTDMEGVQREVTDLSALEISRVGTEGNLYEIRGLESIQGLGDGSYSLFVDGERVVDAFGSAGTGSQSVAWELHETPPTIVDAALDETEALMQSIDTFAMQFSHGVAALDLSACRLTCNGTEYTTDGLVYSIDAADPSRVVITGLSRAVRADGAKGSAVPDGVWELQIDMGGVEDIYGNTGDGVYSKEWEVDTTAPEKLGGITLNGKESLVVADACVTLGFVLPEEGLTVSIYDKSAIQSGRGTLLWQGVAEAASLEQEITLQNGGSRVLTVVTTDAAGNATENVYNVLVDVVALSVTTDLAEGYKEAPEAVRITFNAAVTDFPIEAISLTANGRLVSLEGATLTQISETEWELRGLPALVTEAGSYALSIDRSALAKKASGLQGQGIYSQGFEFDSVTEVSVADCRVEASAGKISGLDITFSTDINFDNLAAEGLLSQAFRLVKQSDGSVIRLEGGSFSYANKTLTWSGLQALEGGEYAVMIDSRLVTASNGSPLKGNEAGKFGGLAYASAPELLAVEGASYAAPYAYDWNGDGFTDLLVGEKTPDSQGKVKIYLNDGAGNYGAATYVQADGGDLAVSASGCQGIVVAMQDVNGDGLADLVAGLSDGAVYIYTARENGIFGAGEAMLDENGHPITTGSRAYPTFFDYTGDGVADLILGAGDGRLLAAVGKAAEQGGLTFAAAQEIEGVTVSGRAAPQFADVNGDGLADLLAGDEDGNLNLFYNNGEGYVSVSQWSLDGVSWERSRITVADLNNDGLQDLIVGGSTGKVYAVYGHRAPDWGQLFDVSSEPTLSNLTARAEGNNLALAWDADGAEGFSYRLQISRTEDFANATTHDGIADSNYTISDLEDGSYYWRIQLVDAQGAPVGDWVGGNPAMVDTTPPEQPVGLVSEAGEAKAVLTWDALPDAAGGYYEVRYSRQADFAESVTMRTDSANLSLSDLAAGQWHWQVRAVDAAGNEGAWSLPASFDCEEPVQILHVAQGLTTVDGKIAGGYYDVNKTGMGDTNLCWAATSANMLAWWQQRHGDAIGISTSVPATSEAIYGTFAANWDNTSGREEYGLTWWLSGESDSQKYQDFYREHHVDGAEGGAWFSDLYDAGNISSLVSENSLATVTATELAGTWEAVFGQGGILSLGVYKNISASGTTGGHSLTLWGFSVYQSTGLLSSVTVSDSDDGLTGLCTLTLAYNEAKNLYQLTSPGSLNGYYLGDYTVLNGYKDIFNPNVTLSTEVQEKIGEGKTRVTLSWTANEAASFTLVVDGTSYEVRGATSWTVEVGDGEHSYRVEAADAAGNAGLAEGTFRTDATAPDAVTNLTAEVLDGTVHFAWEPAVDDSDVTYELEYAFNADFKEAQSISGITETSYDLSTDVTTGQIYWRVKATDTAGNISSWSAVAENALDVIAPDLPAAGLAVVAHGTAAQLSWEAAQDASGIAGYVVEYAMSEDFGGDVQRMRVSSPGAAFYILAENTAYYWRVAAVDGAGNVGEWVEGDSFRTGVANVVDDAPETAWRLEMSDPAGGESHNITLVHDWVGFDDARDFYTFRAKGTGSYAIGLTGDTPLDTPVYLSVGMLDESGAFRSEYSLAVGSGSATTALAGIRLKEGQDYYIRVEAYDKGLGRYNGEYSLSIKADVPEAGTQITDNNSIQTATRLEAGGQEPAEALSGWVGVGDAVDYYRLELSEAGNLKMNLNGLETAAKIKVYTENAEGGTRQIFSRSVKAARGLVDHTLSLTSGTYFVAIASYDNGAGRYNTGYALELEHEGQDRNKMRYALASR